MQAVAPKASIWRLSAVLGRLASWNNLGLFFKSERPKAQH